MTQVLPFERPVAELLTRIQEIRVLAETDPELAAEMLILDQRTEALVREVYGSLEPFEKVQLSRHPRRPYTLDYITRLVDDFEELHGDRRFADDAAIVGGIGRFRGRSVVVLGHQKGRNTKENVLRNFGMPNPEGYRKAMRLYELAERFGLPILAFVDTPGAYPGIGAEERGQSEAIAACLEVMARATVPIITTIIGEGGSGGALALAVANRVLVLEFSYYSVISPEGCAAILWKDGSKAPEAAARLKVTAPDLLELGVVDRVVSEPSGGAHCDHHEAARLLGNALAGELEALSALGPRELRDDRYRRFRKLGAYAS